LIAAVSGGIVNDELLLDLNYEEDSSADVDINLVIDESGGLIEIQGTAERNSFSSEELNELINTGKKGVKDLIARQKEALGVK